MTSSGHSGPVVATPRPWYREPWPWVLIAIPAAAVVAGLFTLYLALSHPDRLVLDVERYQQIRAEMRAQPESAVPTTPAQADGRGDR